MTPAKKYIKELYLAAKRTSKKPIDPLHKKEFILFDAVAVEMEIIPEMPNWAHFVRIKALKEEGKGDGSKGMKIIMGLADKNDVCLLGKIEPYGTISRKKLNQFYEKFGCVVFDDDMSYRVQPGIDADKELKRINPRTWKRIKYSYEPEDFKREDRLSFIIALALLLFLISIAK